MKCKIIYVLYDIILIYGNKKVARILTVLNHTRYKRKCVCYAININLPKIYLLIILT